MTDEVHFKLEILLKAFLFVGYKIKFSKLYELLITKYGSITGI